MYGIFERLKKLLKLFAEEPKCDRDFICRRIRAYSGSAGQKKLQRDLRALREIGFSIRYERGRWSRRRGKRQVTGSAYHFEGWLP